MPRRTSGKNYSYTPEFSWLLLELSKNTPMMLGLAPGLATADSTRTLQQNDTHYNAPLIQL